MKTQPGVAISVVVCTYNRCELLRANLERLTDQSLDQNEYEIVVVDNASTDHTVEVVQECAASPGAPQVKLLQEPQLGLAIARNRGFRSASGDYIAFLDDDVLVGTDWVSNVLECFETVQPRPVSVGGPVFPVFEAPRPLWFKEEYEVDTWGEAPRFLLEGESFSGNNMSFRRDVLERHGGFDVSLGMRGNALGVAEETALYQRIWRSGSAHAVFYYSPHLSVRHRIPAYKMTLSYRWKRGFAEGRALQHLQPPSSVGGRLRTAFRLCLSLGTRGASALGQWSQYGDWRQWFVERLGPLAVHCGALLACLGVNPMLRARAVCD